MRAIMRDSTGKLNIRLKFLGCSFAEPTNFVDSKTNRARLSTILNAIQHGVRQGEFDYVSYFPHSRNLTKIISLKSKFIALDERRLPTVQQFYQYQFEQHRYYVNPKRAARIMACFGDVPVDRVSGRHLCKLAYELRDLREISLEERIRTLRLALNILDQSAVAFMLDKPLHLTPGDDNQALLGYLDVLVICDCVPSKYRDFFLLQYITGLPASILLSLKWEQYRPDEAFFELSGRLVHVDKYARELLFKLKQRSGNNQYVFCNSLGQKLEGRLNWLRNECWRTACLSAGMGQLGSRALRDASVIYLYAGGMSVERICQQTGILFKPTVQRILSQYLLQSLS